MSQAFFSAESPEAKPECGGDSACLKLSKLKTKHKKSMHNLFHPLPAFAAHPQQIDSGRKTVEG